MSQYQTGTCSVTVSSATVSGSATVWSTNVYAGDLFKISGENVIYTVGTVVGDTEITLSSIYLGATATGQSYQITRDFTPNYGFTEVTSGDRDWPYHITAGFIRAVDTLLAARLQGVSTITVTASGDTILTSTQCAAPILKFTGTLGGASDMIIPDGIMADKRQFTINNATTGAYDLTIIGESDGGSGVVVATGKCAIVFSDGTDIIRVTADA